MKSLFSALIMNQEPTPDLVYEALNTIMEGNATEAQIGAFLMGISSISISSNILYTCAKVMKEKAEPISSKHVTLIDTCGTGGDNLGTFNVSTTVALILAGCGLAVAKHGNRSISSKCGSADVLTELGVTTDRSVEQVGECLDEVGITFLFAPVFHKSMKHVAAPRQELGVRTIFNLLGPLANPLDLTHQMVGIFEPTLANVYRESLQKIGVKKGVVVCGHPLDEVSTLGPTTLYLFDGIQTEERTIQPEDFGMKKAEVKDLMGGDAIENASIVRAILNGKGTEHQENIVVLNAGVALWIADQADDIHAGIQKAKEAIDSHAAQDKLNQLVGFTR
jgi:anthranilate phosphoribosyltransferase